MSSDDRPEPPPGAFDDYAPIDNRRLRLVPDGYAKFAEVVDAASAATTKAARHAPVIAFLKDSRLMASMEMTALEDPTGIESLVIELSSLPGMSGIAARVRALFKTGAKKASGRVRERLRDAKEEAMRAARVVDEDDEHHRPDRPIIAVYPGAAVMWVRDSDGHYVTAAANMLRKELRHHQPDIELRREAAEGEPRSMSPNELIEKYGRRVDEIYYDLRTESTRYLPDEGSGGDLYLASCRRPRIEPVFHEEVDMWLRFLAGDCAEVLLDWLATIGVLARPTAALYLEGEKGNGKGLFAEGCSERFGGSISTYNDIAGSGFNSALKKSPIVILNERVNDKAAKSGSGFFRDFIGSTKHSISEKNRPAATMLGCPRLIICANNPDALRIRENLTPGDEDAIGERLVHIDISSEAGEYLKSLGGRGHTANWVAHEATGAPGELCQHIAWLEANREVVHGLRYVIHGSAQEWLKKSTKRGGLKQDILVALAKLCSGAKPKNPDLCPFRKEGQDALVFPSHLYDCWHDITGRFPKQSVGQFGSELKSLSGGEFKRVRINGHRIVGWFVSAQMIVAVAAEMGVGDVDGICKAYEVDAPKGWDLKE